MNKNDYKQKNKLAITLEYIKSSFPTIKLQEGSYKTCIDPCTIMRTRIKKFLKAKFTKPREILYHRINLHVFSNHLQELLADQLKLWATIEVSLQCLQH